jgi:aspartate kinase
MARIVQKYGGSSVADASRLLAVRDRVLHTCQQGHHVVVVVSAMGKTTDGLLQLAGAVAGETPGAVGERDLDLLLATGEQVSASLLSLALQAAGQPAIALTGFQAGIETEPLHTRARILRVQTQRWLPYVRAGWAVIVTGFQGIADGEITTLGRGGSDTSAVAIAAAWEADLCEIYTDVPGIFTTDPRIVPQATLLPEITCDEMLELASQGAKVLHPRSVEIARNFGVKLCVRSSWTEDAGTVVLSPRLGSGDRQYIEIPRFVESVVLDGQQARFALLRVPDRPGIAAKIFATLATAGINVDLIVQSVQVQQGIHELAFTVAAVDYAPTLALMETLLLELDGALLLHDAHVAKVSIQGAGMVGRPGVAAQMFTTLAAAGINIQMISTSEIKVSCVIDAAAGTQALHLLAEKFAVATSPQQELRGDRPVSGVALDQNRARLAVRHVPDRPGIAAQILQALAQDHLSLDVIVQSQPVDAVGEIAFTVAAADLPRATQSLTMIAQKLGCGDVVQDHAIAKVSIVGAGMAHQPGVAARMFAALAESQINIEMIATSEIKVSCVVPQEHGATALRAVHQAFTLSGDRPVPIPGTL